MRLPKRDHAFEETENVLIGPELAPVQPSRLVVLVVRVVIAELRVKEFVSGPEHRGSVREHQKAEEIFDLLPAKPQHRRRRPFVPFGTAVPTVVFVGTVLVVIAICPVALVVIRDEIVQSEAIVRSYVIHALVGMISFLPGVGKEIIAAIDATHQVRNHPRIALNETPDVIAKTPVPLEPSHTGKSAAELICGGVPRLGDQTEPAQVRIGGDLAE